MTPEEIINLIQKGQYALKTATINLIAGAIDEAYVNIPGNFVRCWKATNSFFIGFDNDPADTSFDQNVAIPNREYNRIKVRNPDPTQDLIVSLVVGYGYMEDSRFFIRSGGLPIQSPHIWIQSNVTVSNPLGASSPIKLKDFNANRCELLIENLSTTDTVKVGPTANLSLTGSPIPPGGSRIITCCAEFYAYVESGKSADLVVSSSYYDFKSIYGI